MNKSDKPKQESFFKGGGTRKRWMLLWGILVVALLMPARAGAQEKERTPASLLSAIEQRNQELEKRSKAVLLKEQRMRILEQEISQKLEEIKKVRDQMKAKEKAKEGTDKKALAEAKKANAEKVKAEEEANALEAIKTQAYEEGRQAAFKEMKIKPTPKKTEDLKGAKKPVVDAKKGMTKADAKKERARMAAERRLARAKAASAKRNAQAEAKAKKEKEKDLAATPDLPSMTLDELAALKKEEAARKAVEEKRFKDLAKVYEKMPPAEAALRLQNMHEVTALEIIPRMNKAKLARVLSSMDPVVAVRYTERIGMGGPFFPTNTPPLPPKTDSPKTN